MQGWSSPKWFWWQGTLSPEPTTSMDSTFMPPKQPYSNSFVKPSTRLESKLCKPRVLHSNPTAPCSFMVYSICICRICPQVIIWYPFQGPCTVYDIQLHGAFGQKAQEERATTEMKASVLLPRGSEAVLASKEHPDVTDVTPVPDAYTPIIKAGSVGTWALVLKCCGRTASPHMHKDPTNHSFWRPSCLEIFNQKAGSACCCSLWSPRTWVHISPPAIPM